MKGMHGLINNNEMSAEITAFAEKSKASALAEIPQDLIDRYDITGPRYTSYPAANYFAPLDAAPPINMWRSFFHDGTETGLYLHIPFCTERCAFCGCYTIAGEKSDVIDRYIDTLAAEAGILRKAVGANIRISEMSVGGGSPNRLSIFQWSRLLDAIDASFRFSRNAERSVELDPRRTEDSLVSLLVHRGFNRFSLGVQDFNQDILDLCRAGQKASHIENLVRVIKNYGCNTINFDLVCGLPLQNEKTARFTAERTAELHPSRVALYGFALLSRSMPHQKLLEGKPIPDTAQRLRMRRITAEVLIKAGYIPVGMDHFALPDDDLVKAAAKGILGRTFMGYTKNRHLPMLGMGASAIAGVNGTYSQNAKPIDQYSEGIAKGILPIVRGHMPDPDDDLRREVVLDLACNFSIDIKRVEKMFKMDFNSYFESAIPRLKQFQSDGILSIIPERIEMTPLGRHFIRNVCMVFDRYFEKHPTESHSGTLG